jgi:hypothetical protein
MPISAALAKSLCAGKALLLVVPRHGVHRGGCSSRRPIVRSGRLMQMRILGLCSTALEGAGKTFGLSHRRTGTTDGSKGPVSRHHLCLGGRDQCRNETSLHQHSVADLRGLQDVHWSRQTQTGPRATMNRGFLTPAQPLSSRSSPNRIEHLRPDRLALFRAAVPNR